MAAEELAVIQKTYDLVKWACDIWRSSLEPPFHAGRADRTAADHLLELLIQARYTRQRGDLLRQANLTLEVLRYQVRLAHHMRSLRTNSYEHAGREIFGIGTMVGGWLKCSPQRERAPGQHDRLSGDAGRP